MREREVSQKTENRCSVEHEAETEQRLVGPNDDHETLLKVMKS